MTYFIVLAYWCLGMIAAAFVAAVCYAIYVLTTAWWKVRISKTSINYKDYVDAEALCLLLLAVPPALYTLVVYLFF